MLPHDIFRVWHNCVWLLAAWCLILLKLKYFKVPLSKFFMFSVIWNLEIRHTSKRSTKGFIKIRGLIYLLKNNMNIHYSIVHLIILYHFLYFTSYSLKFHMALELLVSYRIFTVWEMLWKPCTVEYRVLLFTHRPINVISLWCCPAYIFSHWKGLLVWCLCKHILLGKKQ